MVATPETRLHVTTLVRTFLADPATWQERPDTCPFSTTEMMRWLEASMDCSELGATPGNLLQQLARRELADCATKSTNPIMRYGTANFPWLWHKPIPDRRAAMDQLATERPSPVKVSTPAPLWVADILAKLETIAERLETLLTRQ